MDATTDMDRMVATAVGDHPDRAPVRPAGSGATQTYVPQASAVPFQRPKWQDPGGTPQVAAPALRASDGASPTALTHDERRTLDELHRRVKGRLDALGTALVRMPGQRDAMNALVIYYDERIMERLPDYLRPSWPLLQREITGSITGGEDFYRFASELPASTPSFVFEVYYFCLANGFVGRYANDMESIQRHEHRLRESIEQPNVPTDSPDTTEVWTGTFKPIAAWVPYTVSLLGVVVITATLTVLSNF